MEVEVNKVNMMRTCLMQRKSDYPKAFKLHTNAGDEQRYRTRRIIAHSLLLAGNFYYKTVSDACLVFTSEFRDTAIIETYHHLPRADAKRKLFDLYIFMNIYKIVACFTN